MLGSEAALWYSVRAISRPVESPCACRMRLRLCAPSRVNASRVPSRSNSAPHSISSWMAAGPSSTSVLDGRAVAQAVAGVERVLLVQLDLVVVAQGHRDAALRVFGRGFPQAVLGHHQHAPGFRQFDRRAQPGDAGSDHQKIGIHQLLAIITGRAQASIPNDP